MSDQPNGSRFSTLAIHAGRRPRAASGDRTSLDVGGADLDPLATDLLGTNVASLARLFDAGRSGLSNNSPQAELEERVAALDGGSAAIAIASGQMARLLVVRTLLQPGDEIVTSRQTSRSEQDFFGHAFSSFGWHAKAADPDKPESFVEALSDKTKAILVESISELGTITDLEAIARVAKRARVPLVVDNSLATPVLIRPIEHGADLVLYAEPKLLCGPGADVGLIVDGGSFDWTDDPRYPAVAGPVASQGGLIIAEAFGNFAFAVACRLLGQRDFGGAAVPSTAAALSLGIETLPLRMQRHGENALAVARHLQRNPAVSRVEYAGLAGSRGFALHRRCCPEGAGVVLTFQLAGGQPAEARFFERLKLVSNHEEVGDTRSTVAATMSSDVSKVLRMSVGLEDIGDIIADLDQALAG